MTSEELCHLLTNFQEESLTELGMEKEGESWIHPNSKYRFEVYENRLSVSLGNTMISRLNASIDKPEDLYSTFVDTEVVEPAVHLIYLKEQGLDL